MTTGASTAAGTALLLWLLVDVFRTLAHPGAQGRLSRYVLRNLWYLARRRRRAALIGPVAMVGVILLWGLLAVLGWALIYWPWMPDGFTFTSPVPHGAWERFVESVSLSMVMISTLGLGDVVPRHGWLRLAAPLESLLGLALLTVALSWVMQVYPALARRRALAVELSLMRRTDLVGHVPAMGSAALVPLLHSLTCRIIDVRVDLQEYAEIYFFREDDTDASLPANLDYAARLHEAACARDDPAVVMAGSSLGLALDDLAGAVDSRFLRVGGGRAAVFDAYAADHGHRR